ncbi:Serine/threonine protein kinase OS=Streptomyces tendae OX=1932 GN=GUR47_21095 PE=4 SV=1 [Streptomyces tendae]
MKTRYLLVWLTDLPMQTDDGQWRGRVADIKVTS